MRLVSEPFARLATAAPVVFEPRNAALVKLHGALQPSDRRVNALMNRHQCDEDDHRRRDQGPWDEIFKSQDDHQRDDRKNDTPPEPDLAAALLFVVEGGAARGQTACVFFVWI